MHRVDLNPNDPATSVLLRLVGFRVAAELPPLDERAGGTGGTVIIEQSDIDVAPTSLLKVTQQSLLKYECSLVMSPFTMVIEEPGSERLVLSTKNKFTLTAQLTQYPPKGDQFQLQEPVGLVDPDKPDTIVATILKFQAKVSGM
ncbi:hypothetical protein ACWGKW_43975 [Streptomyces sp. NPDC054766]